MKGRGRIYYPDIRHPKTFNEKMLHSRYYLKEYPIPDFADKVLVRKQIADLIGQKYLVPVLGVFNNPDEIDFIQLPNRFVIKTNHGSGWNIVCQNKSKLDIENLKQIIGKWLQLNYYDVGREWQYKNIKPKILVEQFLTNINGTPITDFKLFCFNGAPKYIQVDIDRFTNHRRQFYDLNWNLQKFTTLFKWESNPLPKPKNLEEMILIGKKLSEGWSFVRVDLYNDGNNIYFGELTLNHGGGCEPFIPYKYDLLLGQLLKSDNENRN